MNGDNRGPGSGRIKRLCFVLAVIWLALIVIGIWPGIAPDATPGDIWEVFGLW